MVNKIRQQITLPSPAMAIMEVVLFCSVFLATGAFGLNATLVSMIFPMTTFVIIIMFGMIVSGVYRADISRSIVQLYQRTVIGYLIAGVALFFLATLSVSQYYDAKFLGFVLIFSFCVVSTIRPLIVDGVSLSAEDRRAP